MKAPVSRLMNLTVALRMSPAVRSNAGSPVTAEMSSMVADRITVAVELSAEAVVT